MPARCDGWHPIPEQDRVSPEQRRTMWERFLEMAHGRKGSGVYTDCQDYIASMLSITFGCGRARVKRLAYGCLSHVKEFSGFPIGI
jgi:hypothetical protein